MLCRKFEMVLIKIGFFMNFKSCSKIEHKIVCTLVPADESISMSLSRLSYSPISRTFCCMSLVAPPTLPTVRNK